MIDLEDRLHRGELLGEASPLVQPPHSLHEDTLRRRADDVVVLHVAKLDFEVGLVPDERAVDDLFAAKGSELCVDQLAVAKEHVREVFSISKVDHAALSRHLERLKEVDDRHVLYRSRKMRASARVRARRGNGLLRAARQEKVYPRQELAHEDGLGEVILDAQLEAADLVLDRFLTREEDHRNVRPLRSILEALDERVAVELRQAGVAQDEVRRLQLDLREGVEAVGGSRDAVTSLLKADLEDPHASRVGVHQQELLLGHGQPGLSFALSVMRKFCTAALNFAVRECSVPRRGAGAPSRKRGPSFPTSSRDR